MLSDRAMRIRVLIIAAGLLAFDGSHGSHGSDGLPRGIRRVPQVWAPCLGLLVAASAQRPQFESLEWRGKRLPVPFGFGASEFRQRVLKAFHNRASLEVLVFYGSRTHFQYGYYPDRNSDLDVISFETRDVPPDDGLFAFVDFPVHWRRGLVSSVDAILDLPELRFPGSQEQDIELHRMARELAGSRWFIRGDWKGEWEKIVARRNPLAIEARLRAGEDRFSFGPSPVPCVLGKESLVFLRSGPESPANAERFARLGFTYIGVVREGQTEIEIR